MIQSLFLIFTFTFLSASTNLTESKPRIFLKTWSTSKSTPIPIEEPKEIPKTEIYKFVLVKTIMDQLVANLVTKLSQKEEPKEGPKTEPREIPTEEPKKETKPLISILRFLIKSKQIEEPKPLMAILTKSKEIEEPKEKSKKEPKPALLAILPKSRQVEETKKEPNIILENRNPPIVLDSSKIVRSKYIYINWANHEFFSLFIEIHENIYYCQRI